MILRLQTLLLFIAAGLLGQATSTAPAPSSTPSTPAVELKRALPVPTKTFVDNIDFDANVNALRQSAPGATPPPVVPEPETRTSVPQGYRAPADIALPEEYVSRVAFVYNDDDGGKKWKEHFAEQKREEVAAARPSAAKESGLTIAVDRLHFGYEIKGGNENMRPRRVFDDGAKTYIQMSPNVTNREAPVLVIVGADGKGEMVNYRMKDQTYIVDRLFERARLVLGSGKKVQKVEINRERRG